LYAFALDSILPGNAQKELGDLSNIANLIIL
ncbi:serine dehydratase, partial [Bacillus cereus]